MSKATHLSALFQGAVEEGTLSMAASNILTDIDLGAQINAGLGVSVDDVTASEVFLGTNLIDDSGSIRFGSNAQAVRDGHNFWVASLKKGKGSNDILAHTRYLNGRVLYPYRPIDQAVDMTSQNYDPSGGTPLYDQTLVILGTVIAKCQEFLNAGVGCSTGTLILTDGHDEGSFKQAADCAKLIREMTATKRHVIAAMGVDDGGHTDFRAVFQEMGITDEWILTPQSTSKAIRAAMRRWSQVSSRMSKGGAHFSAAAAGGFATP